MSFFDNLFQTGLQTFNSVSDTASSWADSAVKVGSDFYKQGEDLMNAGVDEVKAKYNEAVKAVWALDQIQKSVDSAIASLPAGPEKTRLETQRDEARTFFSQYVAPLVNKVITDKDAFDQTDFKDPGKYSNVAGFGVLPIAAIAVGTGLAAAAAALAYYANQAYAMENAILNDPTLDAATKLKFLSSTGVSGAVNASKGLAVLGIIGLGLWIYGKGKKS